MFIGFGSEGNFVFSESELPLGIEIVFVPKQFGTKEKREYFEGLLQHVYPAVLTYSDEIEKTVQKDILKAYILFNKIRTEFINLLCDYEIKYIDRFLDYPELENFGSFLDGRTKVTKDLFRKLQRSDENYLLLCATGNQLMHDLLLGARVLDLDIAAFSGSAGEPVLKITSDRRAFSSNWETNWDIIFNKDKHPTDYYGVLQGCYNFDAQNYADMIAVFRSLAKQIKDKRNSPFEHLKVTYPKDLPCRDDLLDDISVIMDNYGMPKHPAMWTVSRKKGNKYALHICLSLIPQNNDTKPIVIESEIRGNGKPTEKVNWEGCRQAAAAAIGKKYGFETTGLSFDAKGRRIAPLGFERYNRWITS